MRISAPFVWTLIVAALIALGCASPGSGSGGLTLEQTREQVDVAMRAFQNASITGDLTTAQRDGIEKAYKEYKQAYDAALVQAESNDKAAAPDPVKAAAEGVVSRVSSLP